MLDIVTCPESSFLPEDKGSASGCHVVFYLCDFIETPNKM